ncbi:SurA N-terminal domain-containing protein, partial [Candidatus Saccharibacteria bacterium]|nr:SurA N-terminal domain-containing protein [Candidatus Saccharibacteria bacterium]
MLGKKMKSEQITSENIHKHRKAILKNGRKFKFPVQYLQHRVIINTIIIGVLVLAVISGVSYWQLYHMHNTGDVLYGITRILPLNAARIDGHPVRFSDYLASYRSSVAVIERQEGELPNTPETAARLMELRREAMDTALENAFALGLARELGISISREEIEEQLVRQRNTTGAEVSEASFGKIIRDNFNLSLAEYKRLFIELPLYRSRVAVEIDEHAPGLLLDVARLRGEGKSMR